MESDRLSIAAFVRNALNDVDVISAGVGVTDATRDENGVALDGPVSSEYVSLPRSIGLSFAVRF